MRIIGLTGGIACGKSHVSSVLREMGVPIADGDQLARVLTAPCGAALPAIRAAFGGGVFNPDGTLDRKALGKVVFSDREALATLDRLMEPLLMQLIRDKLDSFARQGAPLCVMDMPLLYERGLDALCQRVWCVTVPREVQIARLYERDGLNREEAQARIDSQLPVAEKAARADVVIDTRGSMEETRSIVLRLWQEEVRRAQKEEEHGA